MNRPATMSQAIDWANAPDTRWGSTGSGRIELALPLADAQSCHHSGQCDADVEALAHAPYVAEQLAAIAPDVLREELREYGAWEDDELQDHAQNLQRILWLLACDIAENAP